MTDQTGPDKPSVPEQPFKPQVSDTTAIGSTPPGTSGSSPAPSIPARPTPAAGASAASSPVTGSPAQANSASGYTPPRPKRTSAEIRADIDSQRAELGESVDQLRDRVTELTDWRSQIKKHRKQIIIGAVATGFIVGGLAALRRR